jgi:6-phospho-3-hexuloisomerase
MSTTTSSGLTAFESAFNLLIRTAKGTVNNINANPRSLALFCQNFSNARDKNKTIHILGSGRSGIIAKILGESLKDLHFSVSYFGKDLAIPINKDDIALAITGSGWSGFTTSAIEYCLQKQAKIFTFTGNKQSKAARMSDAVIQIPLGYRSLDQSIFFTDNTVPLTPLGTIFELTTFAIGIGIINGIFSGSCTNGFNTGTTNIVASANETFKKLILRSELYSFLTLIKEYCGNSQSKVYFIGRGINRSVKAFCSSRFQLLNINACSIDDWRFRKDNDLVIIFSGSGSTSATFNIVHMAKKSNMRVVYLTSFPDSEVANSSDIKLHIFGRNKSISPDELKLDEPAFYSPSFEYSSLLILEACVAQIALDLGLTGEEF